MKVFENAPIEMVNDWSRGCFIAACINLRLFSFHAKSRSVNLLHLKVGLEENAAKKKTH